MPHVEDAGAPGAADLHAPPGGTETVLVVEDDTAVREGFARILRRRGYDVLLASGEVEAMAHAIERGGRIDLIVSDIVLPGASGPEVIANVRTLAPGVRVLLVSGYSDHQALRDVIASETDLLHKPFSSSTLVRKVRDILDRELDQTA